VARPSPTHRPSHVRVLGPTITPIEKVLGASARGGSDVIARGRAAPWSQAADTLRKHGDSDFHAVSRSDFEGTDTQLRAPWHLPHAPFTTTVCTVIICGHVALISKPHRRRAHTAGLMRLIHVADQNVMFHRRHRRKIHSACYLVTVFWRLGPDALIYQNNI